MAGKDIYLGKMMEALDTKLNSVMASIGAQTTKMDEQITKMDQQVNQLVNISASTSQSVSSIKVVSSADLFFEANMPELYLVLATTIKTWEPHRFYSNAGGTLTVKARIKSSGTEQAILLVSTDGGTTKQEIGRTSSTVFVEVSKLITVNNANTIIFYCQSNTGNPYITVEENSVKFYGKLNNIIDGGGIIKTA
jgi:hypothetical protein